MTQTLITGKGSLITASMDALKDQAPKDGYYLAFSGGKLPDGLTADGCTGRANLKIIWRGDQMT